MTLFDRDTPETRLTENVQASQRLEAAALWSAIRADLRARDERTARLRAMRLAVGEDPSA